MATLPLAYVYVNGTANLSRPTKGILPSGEKLDGKKAYRHILSYFISTDLSPEDVLKTGQDVLDEYYPQVSKRKHSYKEHGSRGDTKSA